MAPSDKNEIIMSPAPHLVTPVTTQKLMLYMVIALLPEVAFSIYLYSIPALTRIICAVATAVLSEYAFRHFFCKDVRISDLSAVITGLLIALISPPLIPFEYLIIATIFGIVVGKEFFGGLGANPFNPALLARAFMFVSFSKPMSSWILAHNWQWNPAITETTQANVFSAFSSATPLASLKPLSEQGVLAASDIAESLNYFSSGDLYWNLFLGERAGSMGESSIVLILISLAFLLWKKVIDMRIPLSMVITTVILTGLAGVNPLLTVLSGGLLFGAVFMATDYATTPVTPRGKIVFGIGCGIITSCIRLFAGIPEGVMFSILIMNAFVPFLDRLIPRKYGFIKKKK